MNSAGLPRARRSSRWFAAVAIAVVVALAGARCARDVPLGVDPDSDGGALDATADGGDAD